MAVNYFNLPTYKELLQLADNIYQYKFEEPKINYLLRLLFYISFILFANVYFYDVITFWQGCGYVLTFYFVCYIALPKIFIYIKKFFLKQTQKYTKDEIDILLKIYQRLKLQNVNKLTIRQKNKIMEEYYNCCCEL